MEGEKAQDLYLPQTRALRSIMKFVKSELEHYEQMSGKERRKRTAIFRSRCTVLPKLLPWMPDWCSPDAEDDQNSKTNEAVRRLLRSLKNSRLQRYGCHFADNYQNKQSGFNLYDDIRNKLIAEGVPADEIVVMRSGMTVKKNFEIFEKVNRGEVRVILSSTFTLGTGVNIQERLHTLIHLDAPNRPMDYTQRNGRILRQGNLHKDMNKPVRILRFGVETVWMLPPTNAWKQRGAIADSIMNGKQMMNNSMTNRVLEEEEDVFGDTVAQLSGSEYAMLKTMRKRMCANMQAAKAMGNRPNLYPQCQAKTESLYQGCGKAHWGQRQILGGSTLVIPRWTIQEIVIGKHRFASVDKWMISSRT